jgi:multiple antibiotic resistance protein
MRPRRRQGRADASSGLIPLRASVTMARGGALIIERGGMKDFWQAFLPMFVAMDPIGLIPFFIAFTSGTAKPKRGRVIIHSTATALIVALAFLFAGKEVRKLLGVTIPDFLIAGGALLFVLALADLLAAEKPSQTLCSTDGTLGVVPLGVPLIVGPAVLATSQVLLNRYG